jgi:hypothetical protein
LLTSGSICGSQIEELTDDDKLAMVQWLKARLQTSIAGAQKADATAGIGMGSRASPKLKAGRHQLGLFCDVYDAAQKLSQYVAINYVGFIKGMKKFEKRTSLSVGHIFSQYTSHLPSLVIPRPLSLIACL